MKKTTSSFFQKEELKNFLSGDDRFIVLKPERKEAVLKVLSEEGKEEVSNLNKSEWRIVADTRGF